MAFFRKTTKKKNQQDKKLVVELSDEELLKLSIKEKLKGYKSTQGKAEFSGVMVIPKGDRTQLPKMEFEVFGFDS